MLAPEKFTAWMTDHQHTDTQNGYTYRYHSRSNVHAHQLSALVLDDLLAQSPSLRRHAARGWVVSGINARHVLQKADRPRGLNLAIGTPINPVPAPGEGHISEAPIRRLLMCCETKTVMTEHGKSKSRLFDELNSSHEIVHSGEPQAIAAGITLVNIARRFASPLRQRGGALAFTTHQQPLVTASMIAHLRTLPLRHSVRDVGFDAYATIVLDCDNIGPCTLYAAPPSPQPGDLDHYSTLINRMVQLYEERFSSLFD